jgi:hypothetical protein
LCACPSPGGTLTCKVDVDAYKILVRKPESKKPFGSLRCRLEDNIKIKFKGMGCEDVYWFNLAQTGN